MKLTISVTAADIDFGIRRDCNRCPVAQAIKRALDSAFQLPDNAVVIVNEQTWEVLAGNPVALTLNKYQLRGRLPDLCRHRINCYDAIGIMPPFEFELELKPLIAE